MDSLWMCTTCYYCHRTLRYVCMGALRGERELEDAWPGSSRGELGSKRGLGRVGGCCSPHDCSRFYARETRSDTRPLGTVNGSGNRHVDQRRRQEGGRWEGWEERAKQSQTRNGTVCGYLLTPCWISLNVA